MYDVDGVVDVTVKDKETGKPIKNAIVIVYCGGSGKQYFTDENGKCKVKIPKYHFGSISIEARKEGYETALYEITVGHILTTIELLPEKSIKKNPLHYSPKILEDVGESPTEITIPKTMERKTIITENKQKKPKKFLIKICNGNQEPIDNLRLITSNGEIDVENGEYILEGIDERSIRILDPYNVYEEVTVNLNGEEIAVTLEVSKRILNFNFTETKKAKTDFDKALSRLNPSSYDLEIPKYLKQLCLALSELGDLTKKKVKTLRGKFDVLEFLNELDKTSAKVIQNVVEILTSREGIYLLYDIKRFKRDSIEENSPESKLVKEEIKLDITREEVERLSLEVDREIAEVMREGVDGYFFSALYQVYKSLDVKHAYIVPYLLLSTIKLMLQSHSIKNKLKGLAG